MVIEAIATATEAVELTATGASHAILVGLQYSHDRFLPGIIVDLYQTYSHLLRCGYQRSDIYVLTDIAADVRSKTVLGAILNGFVDADILSFIADLQQLKRLVIVSGSGCRSVLEAGIVSTLKRTSRLFIYYTGHGMTIPAREVGQPLKGGLLMPDYTIWFMDDVVGLQLQHCRSDQSVVWWMDCCGIGEIALPYRLTDGRFRLDRSVERLVKRSAVELLIIVATSQNEKSVASSSGSIFTRSIITALQHVDSNGSLSTLIEMVAKDVSKLKVNHRQTVSIVSTLPLQPILPRWLMPVERR
jgi:hypothetical protein